MIRLYYDHAVYPDAEGMTMECDICGRRNIEKLYLLPIGGCVCADCALREKFDETHTPANADEDDLCDECGDGCETLYVKSGKKYCVWCAIDQLRAVDGTEIFL